MTVLFNKSDKNIKTPEYATKQSAGLDMYAKDIEYDFENNVITYDTGISMAIPKGHCGLLFSRSSICNRNLQQANCVGIIDSDYRGTIKFKFRYTKRVTLLGKLAALFGFRRYYENVYEIGDKVGQLVIMPYPMVELKDCNNLDSTERGTGGFGSTDKKPKKKKQ